MKNLNKHNVKKWYKMLTGKSILHVNQGIGKIYSKNEIKGYYNDLTEKVTKGDNLSELEIPKLKIENGEEIIFPIAVFQYGLGAYDLYLLENKEVYLNKFKLMADWALKNQEKNGAWNNFFYIYPDNPYSAMAQGEGASLLIRAYIQFKNPDYLNASKRAIEFMLKPVEQGGTTLYKGDNIYFQEYTHKPTVLNGWIFSIFGLYDYIKVSNDKNAKEILRKTLITLELQLGNFDNGYWSKYDTEKTITSIFYHNLHIAQLKSLYDLFEIESFSEYANKWLAYRKKRYNRYRAFAVKVLQKITENKSSEVFM